MTRIVVWLLGLAAVVWAAVAGVQWLTPQIEKDISQRVNTTFAERGLLFADAQVAGREVTVVGDAPDGEAHDKALSAAAQTFGVAKVVDAMTVAGKPVETTTITVAEAAPAAPVAPENYTLTITKEDESVELSGMIPDENSRKVLMKLAVDRYGAEHVSDKLTVVEAGAPEGWRSAAGTVLFNLSQLEKAHASLSNTEVMVSGEALDEKYADQAEDNIKKALPTNFKAAMALDVVEPEVIVAEVEPAAGEESAMAETAAAEDKGEGMFSWWNSAGKKAMDVADDAADTAGGAVEGAVAAADKAVDTMAATAGDAAKATKDAAGKLAATVTPVVEAPAKAATTAGCADVDELAIHKVMFAFDSAKVTKVYDGTFDKVAAIMKGCGDLMLTVEGHTDRTGSTLYNQWLSEQRAESGVRALRRRGVEGERLSGVGYGESRPVGDNATRSGRAANRRIEFVGERKGFFSGSWFGKKEADGEAAVPAAASPTSPSWWDRITGAVESVEQTVSATTK
ncbi:MAG: OmpA family protein [Pseudomonadaceae bacterium]|nr:OmpA family protein [Pseudomonadaceae bacterium]